MLVYDSHIKIKRRREMLKSIRQCTRKERLYEAISIADYIMENHTISEAAQEFDLSATTIRARIKMLASDRPKLYIEVINFIHKKDHFENLLV